MLVVHIYILGTWQFVSRVLPISLCVWKVDEKTNLTALPFWTILYLLGVDRCPKIPFDIWRYPDVKSRTKTSRISSYLSTFCDMWEDFGIHGDMNVHEEQSIEDVLKSSKTTLRGPNQVDMLRTNIHSTWSISTRFVAIPRFSSGGSMAPGQSPHNGYIQIRTYPIDKSKDIHILIITTLGCHNAIMSDRKMTTTERTNIIVSHRLSITKPTPTALQLRHAIIIHKASLSGHLGRREAYCL